MEIFERPLPTEQADIDEIVRGVGMLQAREAARLGQPLGRGTHVKGVVVRGQFEVCDLAATVDDPALRQRLARGLFARPGTYPAVVRFANGAPRVDSDRTRDARALSFAVTVPPTLFPSAITRVDFSMNDGPTSPLNDAHEFAIALRLAAARGVGGTMAALWSMRLREVRSLVAAGLHQRTLVRPGRSPYQRLRYWSVTPFRHGPDEAVKYSAIPRADNPSRPLASSPDALRGELIRHVAEDDQMSVFDVALQFLDAGRMTEGGRSRDAAYWIENGRAEWREDQAPFHVVGRLTLSKGEHLSQLESRAIYFDVAAHAAPGSEPLGSINRARGPAERASRDARLAQDAVVHAAQSHEPAVPRRSRWRTLRNAAIALVFLGVAAFPALLYIPQWMTPPLERVDQVVVLDQGWGAGIEASDRQTFYYTNQGAGLKGLRYSWFLHLEMPWGQARFADPDNLARYGFLIDPATPGNPDQLPVGFTKLFDRRLNDEILDITCSACHTGQINVERAGKTIGLRIDGGAAMHNFYAALPTVGAAMVSTITNPFKFDRFARKVLADRYPRGRAALHAEMVRVLGGFVGIIWHEQIARNLYPTLEGHGRTDALARISNAVFAENLDAANYRVGSAPVSFPPIWDAWKFDWVQYNASLSQPMARNVGESLGMGATLPFADAAGAPLPVAERYRSTSNIDHMFTIERTLRKLRPPTWPESLLGAVNHEQAEQGRALFAAHCVRCHGPHVAPPGVKARNAPLKTATEPEWVMTTVCADDVGTDPNAAVNYTKAFVDVTRTGLSANDLRAVAAPIEAAWNDRQATWLRGEIARLRAEAASAAGSRQAAPSVSNPRIAVLEAELNGLEAAANQRLAAIDPKRLRVASALNYLGTLIRQHAYAGMRLTPEARAQYDGFGVLDRVQVMAAYKARPLAGIWATAPFLHNGSVPTLFDLLSPVEERPKVFRVGSYLYDLQHMGVTGRRGEFEFDTSLPGNGNRGHEFGQGYVTGETAAPRRGLIGPYLEPAARLAIIEYLKIRDDDAEGLPVTAGASTYSVCREPAG